MLTKLFVFINRPSLSTAFRKTLPSFHLNSTAVYAAFSKSKRNDEFWEKDREKYEDEDEEEEISLSDIVIPKDQVETNFSRSSGAGGQNVNKVNTKAEIRFTIATSNWLSDDVKKRLRELHKNSINNKDELIVSSQVGRTQSGNLEDAFKKMQVMIYEASLVQKEKKNIIPAETKGEAKQRLQSKRNKSDVKKNRNSRNHDW